MPTILFYFMRRGTERVSGRFGGIQGLHPDSPTGCHRPFLNNWNKIVTWLRKSLSNLFTATIMRGLSGTALDSWH